LSTPPRKTSRPTGENVRRARTCGMLGIRAERAKPLLSTKRALGVRAETVWLPRNHGFQPPLHPFRRAFGLAPQEEHRSEHRFGEFRRSDFLRGVNQAAELGDAFAYPPTAKLSRAEDAVTLSKLVTAGAVRLARPSLPKECGTASIRGPRLTLPSCNRPVQPRWLVRPPSACARSL
jgi:hypothetical protein